MTTLLLLLAGLFLASLTLGFFSFWGAARLVAGPTATFPTVLKCQLSLFLLWLGTVLGAVLAGFLTHGGISFAVLLVIVLFTSAAFAFRIAMQFLELSFMPMLGVFLLSSIFSYGCTHGLALVIRPFTAPIVEREAPDFRERIMGFVMNSHRLAPAEAPASGQNAELIQAMKDLDASETTLQQVQTHASQTYAELAEKRKNLDAKNATAVHDFNTEAANYASLRSNLGKQQAEVARLKNEVEIYEARAAAMKVTVTNSVVIYSTSWCPACKAAKAYLTQRNIDFQDLDVEQSPDAAAEFRRLGGTGVPLIVINGDHMTGFSSAWVDEHLKN